MSVPSAADLHRLAEQAKHRGLQLFVVEATGEHFVNSSRAYDRLHRVTAYSCDCRGFLTHGHCTHHSLLLAELGWLPPLDPEPDPATPAPALPIAAADAPVPGVATGGAEVP